jgi:hypothetical protein
VVSAQPSSVRTGQFTQLFATPLPDNAQDAEVVAGFREATVLIDESDSRGSLVAPATSYLTGSMLGQISDAAAYYRKENYALYGTDRLFDTRVTALRDRTATVTTCDDGSKTTEIDTATGAIVPISKQEDQNYAFEKFTMTRLDGHWAIVSVSITPAKPSTVIAKHCLP